MNLRSLLFVPGDRPERMDKALGLGARALILDLEDSVAPAGKAAARETVAAFLRRAGRDGPKLFVRVNPLDGGLTNDDLAAIVPARPDGIVLPKAEGPASLRAVADALAALEQAHGLTAGGIVILPINETPAAVFQLGAYGGVTDRLVGLTWGAEDMPAAVGAATSREPDGRYTPPYEMARALTLFGAATAGVAAIETVFPAFRDLDGLAAYAARGRRDGFVGMMAIHPSQIAVIEAAFAPDAAEIAHARRVVAAFADDPTAGVVVLDGRMVDGPHLRQAQTLLERAD